MAKLTKLQRRNHEKALETLEQDILSDEDKEFVFKHYHEGATNNNGEAGAFFTPLEMADMAAHQCVGDGHVSNKRVIDLCASIGILAFAMVQRYVDIEIVCIECNPEYVKIGKKLVPEATWYCADVMDKDFILSLGRFNCAISNPPFGNVSTLKDKEGFYYTGSQAEYKVMDIASVIADDTTFIVPQMSAGFKYSNNQMFERYESNKKYEKFITEMGLEELSPGMGQDTTCCYDINGKLATFKEVDITVEFACAETHHIHVPVEKQINLF